MMIRPLLLASAALFSLSARAVVVADVQRSQSVSIRLGTGNIQSNSLTTNGALSVSDPRTIGPCLGLGCNIGFGTPPTVSPQLKASSSIGSYPSPFLSANASSPSSPMGSNASAQASFTYTFNVIAPSAIPLVSVPVLITGNFALSANGDAHADGHLSFYDNSRGAYSIVIACGPSDPCLPPIADQPNTFEYQVSSGSKRYGFSASGVLAYSPGFGYATGGITLVASANAGWDSFGTNSASAFIDPVITIDPVFAASHPGYSVVVSDGVGNSLPSAVPEPAEWALITAGLALLSVRTQRRRDSARDAA